jgi:uncharacterized protein HemX
VTVQDYLLLIAGVFAGLVLVIKEIGQWWGRHDARTAQDGQRQLMAAVATNTQMTEKIDAQTNGGFAHLAEELRDTRTQLAAAYREITEMKAEVLNRNKGV